MAFTTVSALLAKGNAYSSTSNAATVSTAGPVTLTTAQLKNAIYNRDGNGGARTDTTPTAAAIIASIKGAVVGTSFDFYLMNVGASTITLAAGTGVTIVGTATAATLNVRHFKGIVSAIGATQTVNIVSLGTVVF